MVRCRWACGPQSHTGVRWYSGALNRRTRKARRKRGRQAPGSVFGVCRVQQIFPSRTQQNPKEERERQHPSQRQPQSQRRCPSHSPVKPWSVTDGSAGWEDHGIASRNITIARSKVAVRRSGNGGDRLGLSQMHRQRGQGRRHGPWVYVERECLMTHYTGGALDMPNDDAVDG
jgi:hypothetical protein